MRHAIRLAVLRVKSVTRFLIIYASLISNQHAVTVYIHFFYKNAMIVIYRMEMDVMMNVRYSPDLSVQ